MFVTLAGVLWKKFSRDSSDIPRIYLKNLQNAFKSLPFILSQTSPETSSENSPAISSKIFLGIFFQGSLKRFILRVFWKCFRWILQKFFHCRYSITYSFREYEDSCYFLFEDFSSDSFEYSSKYFLMNFFKDTSGNFTIGCFCNSFRHFSKIHFLRISTAIPLENSPSFPRFVHLLLQKFFHQIVQDFLDFSSNSEVISRSSSGIPPGISRKLPASTLSGISPRFLQIFSQRF